MTPSNGPAADRLPSELPAASADELRPPPAHHQEQDSHFAVTAGVIKSVATNGDVANKDSSTSDSDSGSAASCSRDAGVGVGGGSLSPGTMAGLPSDVIAAHVLPHLPAGQRMCLRAVSRSWAACVAGLTPHINVVMWLRGQPPEASDEAPATASRGVALATAEGGDEAATRMARVDQDSTWECDGGGGALDGGRGAACGGGLLRTKFPAAFGLRLWVGCSPPALLGTQACDVEHCVPAPAHASPSRAGSVTGLAGRRSAPDAVPGQGKPQVALPGSGMLSLPGTFAAALLAVAAGMPTPAAAWPRLAVLAALVALFVLMVRRRRLRLRAAGARLRSPRAWPEVVWYARHSGRGADSLEWYYRRPAEPGPPSQPQLAACLGWLGGSERLTALSVVSVGDVAREDLEQLVTAFPALNAFALHAHQPTGDIRARTITLASLEPLRALGGAASPGTARPSSADTRWLPARAPRARSFGPQLRSLVLCGVRCEWPGCGAGACGDAGGGGGGSGDLAALSGLRSLVLHRVAARMHRLLPQIRALTQLTRLELLGIDYHHALPLGGADLAAVHGAAERRQLRDERLRHALYLRVQRLRVRREQAGRHQAQGDDHGGGASAEEEEVEGGEEDAEAEEECFEAPWVSLPSWRAPGGLPFWHDTMAALAACVRRLRGLRALACDVGCPPDADGWEGPYWRPLVSALGCCAALESLALPTLRLASPAQARRLAASLPALTRLELAALPPPPAAPEPAGCAALPREERRRLRAAAAEREAAEAEAEVAALRQRYLASEVATGPGPGATPLEGEPWVGSPQRPAARCSAAAAAEPEPQPLSGLSVAGACDHLADAGAAASVASTLAAAAAPDGGCLACFRSLRALTLHHATIAQLACYALPLPPALQELSTPLWHHYGRTAGQGEHMLLSPADLLLLHVRLLPALRRLLRVALAPGPCAAGEAPLLAAMLGAWLGGCLEELDAGALTAPGHVGAAELLACLRRLSKGLPRLRRLSCHLWAARTSLFMPPLPPPGMATPPPPRSLDCRRWLAAGRWERLRGADADVAEASRPGALSGGDAGGVPVTLVECINAMGSLEELRLQVVAVADWAVPPLSRTVACPTAYHPHRVPLGLLRALRRPLRVVDCSPLDCWCAWCPPAGGGGGDFSHSDPRAALAAARAALATRGGCRCCLVAEAEEMAAVSMGLGPELEAVWRKEALHGLAITTNHT